MSEQLFQQFLVILGFSLFASVLFRRLRMATIVAYIAVGTVIGPSALSFVDDPARFSLLAEFGVVFLLFTLGLEFNLKKMLAMRFAVFGVGGVQVAVCTAVFALVVFFWGATWQAAILIAGALALSSTAIVTRELVNNRQMHNLHGQLSIGVLLFQDLFAVVFLVLVPVMGQQQEASLLVSLGVAGMNAIVLLALLLAVGKWLLPLVYQEVARTGSEEIFLLSTLVIVLLAAWLTHSFHLSMALGGFVTGMMLGEGPFRYQIQTDIRPFRDILLGLFFVTIGMSLDLSLLLEFWPRILLFTLALVAMKALVVAVSVRVLGFQLQDALSVGFNLAQAGEFGLALMALAMLNNAVPVDEASFISIIAIFSMVISPFLIRHAGAFSRRLVRSEASGARHVPIKLDLEGHVIIGGFGRLGRTLAQFLEQNQVPYIAIETDIDVVEKARRGGSNIVYGNSNNLEILQHCHLSAASLVVLTFKSLEEGKVAISRIRQRHAGIPIVVRCVQQSGFEELVSVGADQVFPELLESSLLISRQVLRILHIDEPEIDRQVEEFRIGLLPESQESRLP
ncbi:MAG: cation:proton antiporter [Gammaproteobacteria bacterium]|nr:cation:proton antiporter [Pseudomonadales bacterium]MCP5348490.1 cation:proton antiporter [Pseudomonadales bacterium]